MINFVGYVIKVNIFDDKYILIDSGSKFVNLIITYHEIIRFHPKEQEAKLNLFNNHYCWDKQSQTISLNNVKVFHTTITRGPKG